MSKLKDNERQVLDAAVLDVLGSGPLTAYAVSCRVEREMAARGSFAFDWRDVDRSLQRLRKRGLIATKRDGSFSHWRLTEAQ